MPAAQRTRATRSSPKADGYGDLSPEVRYYLKSRGYKSAGTPPAYRTPEPSGPGVQFDPARVDRAIEAMRRMPHTQGRWAGKPFEPGPWEVGYIIAPVFGWVHPSEEEPEKLVRVIQSLYVELPRKNGKTSVGARMIMVLGFADGEPGAQCLTVAASKDQARYAFDPMRQIAKQSPSMKDAGIVPLQSRVIQTSTGSYLAVVSSIGDLLHGANVHGALVDELHIHKDGKLLEAVETGTGARDQPLAIVITTADDGRQGTVYDHRRRLIESLARRTISDQSTYGVIWAADSDDDPFDEKTWIKANPNYGISPSKAYMRGRAKRAQQSPADLASFQRLHLGIRTRQETRYLDLAAWDRNSGMVSEESLKGKLAYGGLDLSATTDLTSLCWAFPSDDDPGTYDVIWRSWVPRGAFDRLNDRTAGNAEVWRREGWLRLTEGDVVDYDVVRAQINADRERFEVAEIAYDRWNASQLVNDLLADDAPMIKMGQGFVSMSAPTKELQRLMLLGTPERPMLRHGGNPLVRWEVDGFAAEIDAAGNVKPSKKMAGDKIDDVVSLIMALDRAMNGAGSDVSVYEERGMEVV